MLIDNKPLNLVKEADLLSLMEDKIPESKVIDYKKCLPGNSEPEKKEFLRDVSSFANASGGHLIYGVEEAEGVPVKICGLHDIDPDKEILRLESMVRTGIAPRIPGILMDYVTLENRNIVILVRIPRSWASPHMVTKGSPKFYSRYSKGRRDLDVSEIRSAFLLTETTAERIRNFRAERLSKIMAGEIPTPLEDNPKIVLHIIPFAAFDPGLKLELSCVRNRPIFPISSRGINGIRYNFDGVLMYDHQKGYVQFFRNGIIEIVNANILKETDGKRTIRINAFENELLAKLQMYTSSQESLGVEPPFFIMLSFLNISNYTIYAGQRSFSEMGSPIDRDVLVIPEIVVESFDYDPAEVMRPVFDTIWNAAGWEGSINYNKEGKWIGNK